MKSNFNGDKENPKCLCLNCQAEFSIKINEVSGVLNDKRPKLYCSINCFYLSTRTRVETKCFTCGKSISKRPCDLKNAEHSFCSRSCSMKHNNSQRAVKNIIYVPCNNCGTKLKRTPWYLTTNKNHFCNYSCAAHYRNANKKHGSSRSKLELWIEKELLSTYPELKFKFNSKEEIKSELDIYIPNLKLAFELNGIYHYEPIHGNENLKRVQNNDLRKFQACHETGISLCVIDTSHQKYFKESSSKEFLDIIIKIIEERIERSD